MTAPAARLPRFPLLTPPEMQAWDRRAVEESGIPERVLMESAGRAAARLVQRLYPRGSVVAAVGGGHNGGDALVALRALRTWGREVVAIAPGGAAPDRALLHGWEIPFTEGGAAEAAIRGAGVLIDGLLGTGARGAPREPMAALVDQLNRSPAPVVALDGPTGVDLADGTTPGAAVRAALTVTFGALKPGLLRFPGREHAGRVVVVEVGFPPLRPGEAGARLIDGAWAGACLPRIGPGSHKGDAGTLGVLAGRPGMGGAAILVALGALRAGAGRLRVVSHEANRLALQTAVPEAMFEDRHGDGMLDAMRATDALVAGPGMGTDDDSLAVLRRVLEATAGPVVLDADAVTLLARDPQLLPRESAGRFLLTPHPGEMARLFEASAGEVAGAPFDYVRRAADRYGCAVILKGAPAVLAAPDEPVLVNVTGHSGIATGGMGDTLAGMAGALGGMGATPREAGALALYYAGRAAEAAGRGRGLTPRDVAEALPDAMLHDPGFHGDPPLSEPEVLLDLPAPR